MATVVVPQDPLAMVVDPPDPVATVAYSSDPVVAADPPDPVATVAAAPGKMAEHLFSDKFVVTGLNPDGKKFDKVTRIKAVSENEIHMQLDIATEVFPMCEKEKFNMVLALTLNLDGSSDTGYYTQAGRKKHRRQ